MDGFVDALLAGGPWFGAALVFLGVGLGLWGLTRR